jgi:hypothetical protein
MGIVAGNYINVYWDDVAINYEVQKFDNASDTSGTIITSGPDLGAKDFDHEIISGLQDPSGGTSFLQYRFCDDTTLNTFFSKGVFPYAEKVEAANHEACTIDIVCDLIINDNYTVQKATAVDVPNGAISVTANGSNGTIKFSLDDPDFDYSSQGQESGDFPGILPGLHTITAKDEAGCFDQIEIEVPYEVTFNTRYRLQYFDINGNGTRVDILERDYTGDLEEVCGDETPFIIKWSFDGDLNKFKTIMPSYATLTILSETNFKFRHLFSQDDRKYQIRYYKNFGVADPGFTPATLDSLDDWTNLAGDGPAWNTGIAAPYVDFVSTTAGEEADYLVTSYAFEAGKTYTFSYQLRGGDGTLIATDATFYIQILDSSNNVLSQKIEALNQTFPLVTPIVVTGEYTFIAQSGAAKIAVKCACLFDSSTTQYFIDSFDNDTEAIPGSEWQLKWKGYVIGDNYSEAYLAPPYPVTIVATDGLSDLRNVSFLDLNNQKYREDIITINAIRDILSRTELDINIQCAINRYEENMDQGATDDPLNQCKFSPETFYHNRDIKSCFVALEEILKPFGAIIKQRNAKWFITSLEEHLATIDYREFDPNGSLIEAGQITDQLDIDVPVLSMRAAFRDKDQVLETLPAFGRMFFEHTLLKHPSLIASYGFEFDDVIISPEGFVSFKNWNANISETPGVEYGIKETKSLEGEFNFYLRGIDGAGGGPFKLRTKDFLIEFKNEDVFELSFEHVTLLLIGSGPDPFWVRMRWQLKIGDYFFNEDNGWTTDPAIDPYNYIYVNRYNDNQNFKTRGNFRNVISDTTESAYLEIVLEGTGYKDFEIISGGSSYNAFKAIDTSNRASGYQVRGLYTAESPNNIANWYYILEDSDDAESTPEVVRPDDYNSVTNQKVWRRQKVEVTNKTVQYNYLDNVVLLHYPNGAEPPSNVTIEKPNNDKIKLVFEGAYLLNDIDIDNINNSERTYKNFFKLLNGTPTQVWSRTYRPGEGKLLELLSNDFSSQYKQWSNRLTGSFISDQEVTPSTLMNEVNDGGCKYLFSEFELFDKEYSVKFNLFQVGDVLDEDGGAIDADFNTDFSLDFHS